MTNDEPRDELFIEIGESLSRDAFPQPPSEYYKRGKEWFGRKQKVLQSAICTDPRIVDFLAGKRTFDRSSLIAAVADIILSLVGVVPATVVATLVVREGLHKFCINQ